MSYSTKNPEIWNLPNTDPTSVDLIMETILKNKPDIDFKEIVLQPEAMKIIEECIFKPAKNPQDNISKLGLDEYYSSSRPPCKGILLFGPPGNGKTMLVHAIANKINYSFFNITPLVLNTLHIKNDDRILIIGASNLPHVIDPSVLNILPERIYLRLLDKKRRKLFLKKEVLMLKNSLTEIQINKIAQLTVNYTCKNLIQLIKDSAMASIKSLTNDQVKNMTARNIRPVNFKDFENSMLSVRPSANKESIQRYVDWNDEYGNYEAGISSNSDNDDENFEIYNLNNQSIRDEFLNSNFN